MSEHHKSKDYTGEGDVSDIILKAIKDDPSLEDVFYFIKGTNVPEYHTHYTPARIKLDAVLETKGYTCKVRNSKTN